MRLLYFSILMSVMLHLLLAVLLLQFQRLYSIPCASKKITVTLLDNREKKDIPHNSERTKNSLRPFFKDNTIPVDTEDNSDQMDTNPSLDSIIKERAREYAFLHHPLENSHNQSIPDSLRSSILRSLHAMNHSLEDPGETGIRKRNTGMETLPFHFSDLVPGKTEKVKKKLNLDFIPTEGQIRALDHLFEKGAMQDTDLYPILNSGDFKTFDMYRNEMDRIVDKGLISREKVSPEQLFILFFAPIEMSSKNKKNPEYRYEPLFSKKTLIDYLQSRLFALQQARENAKSDSAMIVLQMEDISKKLSILME